MGDTADEKLPPFVIYCRRSSYESSNKQVASIPRQIKHCLDYAKREKLEPIS